ncbi:alpha/beta fold hydrolase [Spirosoma sp. HMF4905]|uniref:Alpha/beta fold hydrolase n=1 Tax=Spirosoma arboris TaxID=2682092 RepID=A0A7K1SL78_9BACT|nr:alpha/beta hydrolase [Spirosoma arboris]MVM34557.1 alpha/beta fold hydrolase [Spirosoma arboris]
MVKNSHFAGFSSHYFVTADGVKLHYIHKGTGQPLIMIHGWSGTAKDFAMNALPLSEHFSVYILELRGHGYSDAPTYGARISRLSADVHEFVTALSIKKANFMGFSMGSSVLWDYLELFGENTVEKLIFVDEAPALLANPRDSKEEILTYAGNPMDVWDLVNSFTDNGGKGSKFGTYFTRGKFIANEAVSKQLAGIPEPPKHYAFLVPLLRDHINQDWRDVFPRITVPVLMLSGDISHATTVESNEWMKRTIKNSTWIRFSEKEYGTHFLLQNSSQKADDAIVKFLTAH